MQEQDESAWSNCYCSIKYYCIRVLTNYIYTQNDEIVNVKYYFQYTKKKEGLQ